MEPLKESASLVIARSPEDLYDMVADVARMGEWSPICTGCAWLEGGQATAGARFSGANHTPERDWETISRVVAAERGLEFAFVVEGAETRWGYQFSAVESGTEVTESWEFGDVGRARFAERFGDEAEANIENRQSLARTGMPETLAKLKAIAEA